MLIPSALANDLDRLTGFRSFLELGFPFTVVKSDLCEPSKLDQIAAADGSNPPGSGLSPYRSLAKPLPSQISQVMNGVRRNEPDRTKEHHMPTYSIDGDNSLAVHPDKGAATKEAGPTGAAFGTEEDFGEAVAA